MATVGGEDLSSQIAQFELERSSQVPDEIRAPFKAERAELEAAGVPADVAKPGDPMPDADTIAADGSPMSLKRVLAGEPAVVVLYRGAWCPYCNLALRAYQADLVEPLRALGVRLVAISPQKPDGSLTMRETHRLTYEVLSDPGNRIARGLGVVITPTEGTRESQKLLGIDLAEANADGTYEVPMPTVVVVDEAGLIRWIDVRPNYGTRTEPAAVLAAAAEHLGRAPR